MSAVLPRRPAAEQTDAQLVELVRDGDEDAFEVLVRRYWRELLIYAGRFVGAEGRAEDACQQALLQAWLALRDGAEVDDVRPWLYRIVHNSAVSILRRARHDTVELNEALDAAATDVPESRIILAEIFERLSAMPEPQREAIVMTAVRGSSHAETAAKLGLSDGALRGLIYRTRMSLRNAVTAMLPVGLLDWWGRVGARHASLGSDAGEAAGAAGTAGLAAAVVKGGAVIAAAGAIAGSTQVVGSISGSAATHPRPPHVHRIVGSAHPRRPLASASASTRAALSPSAPVKPIGESHRGFRHGRRGSETEARHRGGGGSGQSGSHSDRGGGNDGGSGSARHDGRDHTTGQGPGPGASGSDGGGNGPGNGGAAGSGTKSSSGRGSGNGGSGLGSDGGSGGGDGSGNSGNGSGSGSPSGSGGSGGGGGD